MEGFTVRVWGRIEGAMQTDSDPLGVPTMVYGFVTVPEGTLVDLSFWGQERQAIFVSDTEHTATFKFGKKEAPFTLQHAEYTVCVRRENNGAVLPDRERRGSRKAWDAGIDGDGVWK